ncbi:hypothetical protein [Spirosoma sp. 209]|uniref:hypothetical protein n=1 Tax=Spirosoma sp. 209 TaxID=1955701 RepID=UPI001F1BB150|nr:hypothetical protein [Spirosoma sp. 209]
MAASVRSNPQLTDNSYFVQLIRTSTGEVVTESARSTANPIPLTLPGNLPGAHRKSGRTIYCQLLCDANADPVCAYPTRCERKPGAYPAAGWLPLRNGQP